MDFMLIDSSGNAVEAFKVDAEARDAFVALIRDDPTFARDLALIAFDQDGLAVGEPLVAADLLPDVVGNTVIDSYGWTKLGGAVGPTFVSWAEGIASLTALRPNGLQVA